MVIIFTLLLQRLGFFDGFFYTANHVESLFWQMIIFAGYNCLEAFDGIFKRNILSRCACKLFSHVEWLRQEALDLTGTSNGQFIFRCQFVHTQNRDNVTQFLITLQSLLYATCYVVMLFTYDQWIQLTRSRVQRINCRVNTQRSNITRQHDGG